MRHHGMRALDVPEALGPSIPSEIPVQIMPRWRRWKSNVLNHPNVIREDCGSSAQGLEPLTVKSSQLVAGVIHPEDTVADGLQPSAQLQVQAAETAVRENVEMTAALGGGPLAGGVLHDRSTASRSRPVFPKAVSKAAAKATATSREHPRGNAQPRVKRPTKWGRCWVCQRALIVKLRHADGRPFLSCPKYPRCVFACSVSPDQERHLPVRIVCRKEVTI